MRLGIRRAKEEYVEGIAICRRSDMHQGIEKLKLQRSILLIRNHEGNVMICNELGALELYFD